MQAMMLEQAGEPLRLVDQPVPVPGPRQLLVKVTACGVCRTDLHIADGDLKHPKLPLILGHEAVGSVASLGKDVGGFDLGERVGIPWLGSTCGNCSYCRTGRENLCDDPCFTGYTIDGGYAEFAIADADYCFPVVGPYTDAEAAPLLCAGLIGYRALRLAGPVMRLGLYGFGAAAHIVAQIAAAAGARVIAFTRPGDRTAQEFALSLGCAAALDSDVSSPEPLDAAIIFAPVGKLVPNALAALRKGGTLVLGGIHMSDIPAMPYALLWGERVVRSVANLTREDAKGFLRLAAASPIKIHVSSFALADANKALSALRAGQLAGAAVLCP
jgi:alcohol dehydrogenase, propanol-preferring